MSSRIFEPFLPENVGLVLGLNSRSTREQAQFCCPRRLSGGGGFNLAKDERQGDCSNERSAAVGRGSSRSAKGRELLNQFWQGTVRDVGRVPGMAEKEKTAVTHGFILDDASGDLATRRKSLRPVERNLQNFRISNHPLPVE